MKTYQILVTPDLAKQYLQTNSVNRKLSQNVIYQYAGLMAAGLWKEETGESIKFSSEGRLIDGQHRLWALIKANVSLVFEINKDMDDGVYTVIDQGRKRSGGDVLSISGAYESGLTSSGIKKYLILKKRIYETVSYQGTTPIELNSHYLSRADFWTGAAKNVQAWYNKSRVLTNGDCLGFYAFFYDLDPEGAFTFIDSLITGVALRADNPIQLLREKLILSLISGKKITATHRAAITIKSWNYFREGKTITRLSYLNDEKFPVAK